MKSEVRSPKSETNPNLEVRRTETGRMSFVLPWGESEERKLRYEQGHRKSHQRLDCGVFSAAFVAASRDEDKDRFVARKAAINRAHSRRWREVRSCESAISVPCGRMVGPLHISSFGFPSGFGFRVSDLRHPPFFGGSA